MKDLSSLNMMPLNLQAAKLLQQIDLPWHCKTELAVARLMLWALNNDLLEQEPAWATVGNYTSQYATWDALIAGMEQRNPKLLMQFLTEAEGGVYEINLDGQEPDEAASTLLQELILAIDGEPKKLRQLA